MSISSINTISGAGPPYMVGDINIEKYGIRSVQLISEATFTPRMHIRHFDDMEYSYPIKISLSRGAYAGPGILQNFDQDEIIANTLKEHIKTHCIKQIRKEKLKKIENLPVYEI